MPWEATDRCMTEHMGAHLAIVEHTIVPIAVKLP
jgi:hypothetical protein